MKRACVLWAALVCIALSVACPSEEPEPLTEVLVQIFADDQVQQAGDTLIVELKSGAKSASALTESDPETFDLTESDFRWPVSMALVAKASHESYVFELRLRLEKDGIVLARGLLKSGFVVGKSVVLQTTLGAECLGKLDCPDDETCVVNNGIASCQSAAVDSGSLPGVHDAPKSNDGGTAPMDAGKPGPGQDAAAPSDAGEVDAGSDAGYDAGDPAACVPTGEELCDNGVDDDCNGAVDCGDDACTEITRCVPDALAYALVDEGAECPAGYEFQDFVHQELQDPGCGGCSCEAVQKECSAFVALYESDITCQRDRSLTGGKELKEPAGTGCNLPIGKEIEVATSYYGFRVAVKEGEDTCRVSGEAKPLPPTWKLTRKRCSSQLRRRGCRFGSFCAPVVDVAELCWAPGVGGCVNPENARSYFQGYDDRRSCQACGCSMSGGSCKDVGATMSTEAMCRLGAGTVLKDSERSCESIPSDAVPRMVGKPRTGECSVEALQDGSVQASLQVDLCCGSN
jgi:hypothetical protein